MTVVLLKRCVLYLTVDAEHVQGGGAGIGARQQLFDPRQRAMIQRTVVLRQQQRAKLIQAEAGGGLRLRPLKLPVSLPRCALALLLLQFLRLQEAEAGFRDPSAAGPFLLSTETSSVTFGQHGDGDLRDISALFNIICFPFFIKALSREVSPEAPAHRTDRQSPSPARPMMPETPGWRFSAVWAELGSAAVRQSQGEGSRQDAIGWVKMLYRKWPG